MVLLAHSQALEKQEAGKHFMVNEREMGGGRIGVDAAAESDASTDPKGKEHKVCKSGTPKGD